MGKRTKGKGSNQSVATSRSVSGSSVPAATSGASAKNASGLLLFPAHLLSNQPPLKLAFQPVNVLLPNYIWALPNFFTRHECRAWIDHLENTATNSWEHVQQRGTRYMAARECFRCSRHDGAMAHRLFERLRDGAPQLLSALHPLNNGLFGQRPVTCNPNLRLYKYCPGHAFGKHIDEANVVPGVGVTRLTILIYLSDCEGGATRFYDDESGKVVAFAPQPGAILLHVHGEDLCLEHEADPVMAGVKYVLRTDLVYSDGE